mmetsp:Transcript_20787/g.52349  ORF Transcript_20787/g.52349 Transcript_20787/m.52349 type:complete len:287 (-) Transcript_20787:665-1525(-)|eukprot:CAMPEP_0178995258 /NCGR_PEP_ID=MMETSP0795-20121207/7737_1 /TAXON_ID=88552 /ORGANISM="Amoebophrya sp., Strain Ameob2" /LENGTH=286 /DNA_ID=CAMNT_0020687565 /DNA_START=75 /DNA_END=935 /DNA_ORIENTATION=-
MGFLHLLESLEDHSHVDHDHEHFHDHDHHFHEHETGGSTASSGPSAEWRSFGVPVPAQRFRGTTAALRTGFYDHGSGAASAAPASSYLHPHQVKMISAPSPGHRQHQGLMSLTPPPLSSAASRILSSLSASLKTAFADFTQIHGRPAIATGMEDPSNADEDPISSSTLGVWGELSAETRIYLSRLMRDVAQDIRDGEAFFANSDQLEEAEARALQLRVAHSIAGTTLAGAFALFSGFVYKLSARSAAAAARAARRAEKEKLAGSRAGGSRGRRHGPVADGEAQVLF